MMRDHFPDPKQAEILCLAAQRLQEVVEELLDCFELEDGSFRAEDADIQAEIADKRALVAQLRDMAAGTPPTPRLVAC